MDVNNLIVAGLATAAVGGVLMVLYPYLSGDIKAEARRDSIAGNQAKRGPERGAKDADTRRKQVAESLKEIEAKTGKKVSLDTKLMQAGLNWGRMQYYLLQAGCCAAFTFLVYVISANLYLLVPAALVGFLGLPAWILGYLIKKRMKKFIEAFPAAIDVIVRGIKAGLPLGDCIRIIASEAAEPVKGEFRQIVEAQTIGMSVAEAIERMVDRVPITEASFFSIVIAIQQKAGGNLAEALGNLSRVLRERKKLKQKIVAMSSEATASAGIIGSLPIIVTVLVYLTTPAYISILFIHPTGHFVLACSAFWMFIGVMVMRKMINFDA